MTNQTFLVSRPQAGWTIAAVLRAHLQLSWSAARRLVQQRRVRLAGTPCLDPAQRVLAGQRLEVQALPLKEKTVRVKQGPRRPPKPHAGAPERRQQSDGHAPVIRF